MSHKLLEIVLFSIPEAFVIFCLASGFMGRKFEFKRLVIMAVLLGITVSVIRGMTGSFILNICLSSLVIVLILKFFGFNTVFEASTSGLPAISLYLAIEFVNVRTLQILTGIDPVKLSSDLFLRFLWFLPQVFAALGLSIVIRYFITSHAEQNIELNRN